MAPSSSPPLVPTDSSPLSELAEIAPVPQASPQANPQASPEIEALELPPELAAELTPALTPAQQAAQEPFLKILREFARSYQAFALYDEAHIRPMGLTRPQFDVIATLGNTPGMTMGEIAEKTLVTKGTLTGIVDRLEAKGLVQRRVPPENRRCFFIVLTPEGDAVFNQVFPAHVQRLKERFSRLSPPEQDAVYIALQRVRQIFEAST